MVYMWPAYASSQRCFLLEAFLPKVVAVRPLALVILLDALLAKHRLAALQLRILPGRARWRRRAAHLS